MKNFALKIFIVCFAFCCTLFIANCTSNTDDNTPTTGLEYNLNEDGESYSLIGIGTATKTKIIVPSIYNDLPVTNVGEYSFRDCKTITSIKIPDSVINIGKYAFSGCSNLTKVTIGENVTEIGKMAFFECGNLVSLTLGSSLLRIGTDAFNFCFRLVEIYNLSNLNITKESTFNGGVGQYALDIYTSLDTPSKLSTDRNGYTIYTDGENKDLINYTGNQTNLVINDTITRINENAFLGNQSLNSVTIPNTVIKIGKGAFRNCDNLTSVKIGNEVINIDESAFNNCYSLTSVTIPDSVKSIGYFAFYHCTSITNVIIGSGITNIDNSAFSDCNMLTSVYYKSNENDWSNITIGRENTSLTDSVIYFYSETEPTEEGNYWHYDTDCVTPIVWE